MKFPSQKYNTRIKAPGYSIGANNIVTESRIPCATYPNVCGGMGQSHPPDLRVSQSAATTITRTSDTRITAASGTPWTANVLVGQWAFAYVNSTGLGTYVRITANTTTTIDTDGYFYAGCDRVKTSVWLPKTIVGTQSGGFYGICFDGESVWFAPYTATSFVKVNVATGILSTISLHGEGTNAFIGCCFDGESIWYSPYSSSNFVKVNATTGVKTIIGAHDEGATAFRGCCFDGESIWFAPWTSSNFVKVNVATGLKTIIGAHGEGINAFSGCCFDGESVWFTPYSAANFVKINVTTGVKTTIAHGEGATAFFGNCCFDGESVWFPPLGSSNFVKVNVATGVKITISAHSEGGSPFYGCCFDGENVWFAPYTTTNFVKVNVATGLKTVVGSSSEIVGYFRGCCFDGESIWYCPVASGNIIKTIIPRSGIGSNYKPIVSGTGVFNTRLSIGASSPTAKLQIGAGTATANTAPIKFTAGTNLTSPEAGTIEYDGYFYYTGANAVRNLLGTYTTTIPTGNSYTGKAGQYSVSDGYAYVCYQDNLWNRFLIS